MNYIMAVIEKVNGKEVFYSGEGYNETNCRLVLDGDTPMLNTLQGLKPVPRGCIWGDWGLVEEPKPKSLSDKKLPNKFCDEECKTVGEYKYLEEDVKSHLKRFIDWITNMPYGEQRTGSVEIKAKEEFGARLIN